MTPSNWLGEKYVKDVPERYVVDDKTLEAVLDDIMSNQSCQVLTHHAVNKIIEEAEADAGENMRANAIVYVQLVVKLQKENDDKRPRRNYYRTARIDLELPIADIRR